MTPAAQAAAVSANSNDGSTQGFSNSGSSTALQEQMQLAVLPSPPSQQQQQQQQPGSSLSSSSVRGSIGVSLTLQRRTKGSSSGHVAGGPCQHPNAGSPIVGSQGLLHAMAYGYSKQALDRWVCMMLLLILVYS
jgi:hypothetical protein